MIREEDCDIIFKRKSGRKYDMGGLDEDTLAKINEYCKTLEPLIPGIQTEVKIISNEHVSAVASFKAPYYAAFFSEKKKGFETNAGFMLQQVDLFLASEGLASCWLGMAKPDDETKKQSGLAHVITLAFGKTGEAVHRSDENQFVRKPITEICDFEEETELFKCARFAPSARNAQPWFFTKEANGFGVYRMKPNPIMALLIESFNKIDMGIALCHLAVYAKKAGKTFQFTLAEDKTGGTVKNGVRLGSFTV